MLTDNKEQCHDFCRILVLTEGGKDMGIGTANMKNGLQSNSSSCVDHMDISHPFPACLVTVDIESGGTDVSKISQDSCGSIKTDIALTKPLRRQKSLETERESIQPLMNQILMLLKFDAKEKQGVERSHDGAYNRWKKCKRPNLFDSRRIVLLFSILSSMGTLVLIYLTLRVRQVSDGYIHG